MPVPNRFVEEWLWKHKRQMVVCPHQPGQLRISREACRKRRQAALQEEKGMNGDFLRFKYRQGLQACRKCPIGAKTSRSSPAIDPRPEAPSPSRRRAAA